MIAEENYDFPPTYKLILKNIMPSGKLKVLDLGCGTGVAGEILNHKKICEFMGIDIYEPYLKICRKKGYYKKLVKADITKIDISEKSFDVILLLQVIEHLHKKQVMSLLEKCFKAAKRAVIISVPNGLCLQEQYDDNRYHRHRSTWSVREIKQMGFQVFGQGLKIIYGEQSYGGERYLSWWQKVATLLSTVLLPFMMIFPQISAQLIGIKYLNKKS